MNHQLKESLSKIVYLLNEKFYGQPNINNTELKIIFKSFVTQIYSEFLNTEFVEDDLHIEGLHVNHLFFLLHLPLILIPQFNKSNLYKLERLTFVESKLIADDYNIMGHSYIDDVKLNILDFNNLTIFQPNKYYIYEDDKLISPQSLHHLLFEDDVDSSLLFKKYKSIELTHKVIQLLSKGSENNISFSLNDYPFNQFIKNKYVDLFNVILLNKNQTSMFQLLFGDNNKKQNESLIFVSQKFNHFDVNVEFYTRLLLSKFNLIPSTSLYVEFLDINQFLSHILLQDGLIGLNTELSKSLLPALFGLLFLRDFHSSEYVFKKTENLFNLIQKSDYFEDSYGVKVKIKDYIISFLDEITSSNSIFNQKSDMDLYNHIKEYMFKKDVPFKDLNLDTRKKINGLMNYLNDKRFSSLIKISKNLKINNKISSLKLNKL